MFPTRGPGCEAARAVFQGWTGAGVTIQDLGSLGEFVAAVATLATLGYLAVQIRKNTLAVRAGSHHAVSDSFITVNSWPARDPALARLWRVGGNNLDDLSEDERVQFGFIMLSAFRVYETTYYQNQVGTGEKQLSYQWNEISGL